MSISENLKQIKSSLPEQVTLVAVSKTKPNEALEEAYTSGQRIFGENKVQELTRKYEELPKDIEWHMIGHLQRNKVKYIAPFVALIHGIDSAKLLAEVEKEARKNERVIDCLLQVHIAEEDTKFGFDPEGIQELIASERFQGFEHVRVVGLMGMATFTSDQEQVKREFESLKKLFDTLKERAFANHQDFQVLSMGMSGDYQLAIEAGSTMVRVGSSIFGARH